MAVYYYDQEYESEVENRFDYTNILNENAISDFAGFGRYDNSTIGGDVKIYKYNNVYVIIGTNADKYYYQNSKYEKIIGKNCKKIII